MKKSPTRDRSITKLAPAFEAAADSTLLATRGVYAQRGDEYQDTWALANIHATFLNSTLRSILGERAASITDDEYRLILAAALVDVKDSRMLGPWKLDTVIDGIAYRSAYAEWRQCYEERKKKTH